MSDSEQMMMKHYILR